MNTPSPTLPRATTPPTLTLSPPPPSLFPSTVLSAPSPTTLLNPVISETDYTSVPLEDEQLDDDDVSDTSSVGLRPSEEVDLDPLSSLAAVDQPMSKRRVRRLRRKAVRLHAFSLDKAKRTLLSFIGNVAGAPARILIDCGAEGNVISSSFCKKHSLPRIPGPPIPIVLPDGTSSLSSTTSTFSIARDNYTDILDAFLYPLNT
ncbi:hypothetical protein BGX28_001800, partial [Mortierella sp. GBA30]